MPKIIIFTDFDGTLSGRDGSKTVFSPFYQSLLQGYVPGAVNQEYRLTPLKNSDTIQSLFEKEFGPYNKDFNYEQPGADLLLSREAVKFLHEMLKDENVSVQIITRNRQDYIRALLTYQGFTAEELNRLGICDSLLKDRAVLQFLSTQTENVSCVYVLDDSKEDYNRMLSAVIAYNFSDDQIRNYCMMPGCFEWGLYNQEINKLLQSFTSTAEKKEEEQEEVIDDNFPLADEAIKEAEASPRNNYAHNDEDKEFIVLIPEGTRKAASFFKTPNPPQIANEGEQDLEPFCKP